MNHSYVHPAKGLSGKFLNYLLNSRGVARVRRALMSRLPFPVLESDVVDVVYANWLVDTSLASHLAPPGARLWNFNGRTPLTILTYRHGHFGLRAAGIFRRLMPSPLQSNWRLYLAEPLLDGPPVPTVAFVSNVMDSTLHVIGTRLFSDALPSHLPARFDFLVSENAAQVFIEPGSGSAPPLAIRLARHAHARLPDAWRTIFDDWDDAVKKLASQDAAVVEFPAGPGGETRVALGTIHLPVDIQTVEALGLEPESLQCPLLHSLKPDAEGLFFLLPRVRFTALSERPLGPQPAAQHFGSFARIFFLITIGTPAACAIIALISSDFPAAAALLALAGSSAIFPWIGRFLLRHPVPALSTGLDDKLGKFKARYSGYIGRLAYYGIPALIALVAVGKLSGKLG